MEQLKARVRELEAAMRKKGKCEFFVHKVIIKKQTKGYRMDEVSVPNILDFERDIMTSGNLLTRHQSLDSLLKFTGSLLFILFSRQCSLT